VIRVAPGHRTVVDCPAVGDHPVLPDYGGACVSNIVPALLGPRRAAAPWMPALVAQARQVVLVVLDGLGWNQLRDRPGCAPTLTAMQGGAITTVAPSTTATALTSISTGLPPGEHGVIGYRVDVRGAVLNVLRWTTPTGDARAAIPPADVQPYAPFLGLRPPVVTKAEFAATGFTLAHLAGVRFVPYRQASTLVTEVARLVRAGEPFVYAYYDGIDKVAHEYGLGEHYDAELAAADRLVADIRATLPDGAVVLVTADHGQVDVGDRVMPCDAAVAAHMKSQSGEGRFRWLHALRGREADLYDAALACHGDDAWVVTRDEVIDQGWFGPQVSGPSRSRLGDVALVARTACAFDDPADTGPYVLLGRHGSLTEDEMLVPLLAGTR